jgi:hypothetical protein
MPNTASCVSASDYYVLSSATAGFANIESLVCQTGGRWSTGDPRQIGISHFLDMFGDVVEVVKMKLLLVNDRLEKFHAAAVTVVTANHQ